jgi:hypothetical protein
MKRVGKLREWLAGVLAGITAILSPESAALSETTDYLAYPPLPSYVSEDGKIKIPVEMSISDDAVDQRIEIYFSDFDDSPHLILLTYFGALGLGDKEDTTPVLIYAKIREDAGVLNFGYWERSNFGANVVIMASDNNSPFDIFYFAYSDGKSADKGEYFYPLSHESAKVNRINCSYVVNSSVLTGTSEQYTGHSYIGGIYYNVLNASNGSVCTSPLYNFWLGHDGGGTPEPPDPPGPPEPPGEYDPDKDLNKDTDGDGEPDLNIDTNNDGKADLNIDLDGDGTADINIDTNGDNRPDINIDTNSDNRPDINIDTNSDNRPDINIDTDSDNRPDINIDTNSDNRPDINIDTNGDNRSDINIDTDGDNRPNINIDTNDDNKPDINIDTDGDNRPDINIDTDGDGIPDHKVSGSDIGDGSEFVPDDSYKPNYDDWHLFDPFDYTDTFNDPFADDEPYDPLEGWEGPQGIPGYEKPEVPPYRHCWEPFLKPTFDANNH